MPCRQGNLYERLHKGESDFGFIRLYSSGVSGCLSHCPCCFSCSKGGKQHIHSDRANLIADLHLLDDCIKACHMNTIFM